MTPNSSFNLDLLPNCPLLLQTEATRHSSIPDVSVQIYYLGYEPEVVAEILVITGFIYLESYGAMPIFGNILIKNPFVPSYEFYFATHNDNRHTIWGTAEHLLESERDEIGNIIISLLKTKLTSLTVPLG